MYKTLIIEYMDGSVEEISVSDVGIRDDVLIYYKPFGTDSGRYGVPLVNVKKYRIC